jgi:hypothetical protein
MLTGTFSIAALDRETGEIGVGVASKALAAGTSAHDVIQQLGNRAHGSDGDVEVSRRDSMMCASDCEAWSHTLSIPGLRGEIRVEGRPAGPYCAILEFSSGPNRRRPAGRHVRR